MLISFAVWAALGLFFGRFISVWFPFMPMSRFYLPIRGKRLQRLLTSEDTLFWGRTRPKYLPEQYYLVSPANRGKISLWGVIFYAGWLVLAVLFVLDVVGQISKAVGDWLMILIYPGLSYSMGWRMWTTAGAFIGLPRKKKEQAKSAVCSRRGRVFSAFRERSPYGFRSTGDASPLPRSIQAMEVFCTSAPSGSGSFHFADCRRHNFGNGIMDSTGCLNGDAP